MYGDTRWNAVSVLPTGTSINPHDPVGATYFDKGLTAYVLFKLNDSRTRPTRVLTSHGPVKEWKLDTEIHLEHDQTNQYMGHYKIVGIHHFESGEMAGQVPTIKIKHGVLK